MNFLAHLVLGPQTPEGYWGAIAPDMIHGPLPADLPTAVMQAAIEHQRIDRFTDRHPAFLRTRDRLRQIVHPRLAGILADMVYDHVLARDWSDWRSDDLEQFVSQAERALLDQCPSLPTDSRWRVELMLHQQWLISYATADGLLARLCQMSSRLTRRLGRPMSLVPSAEDLATVYPDVADDFSELWPALKSDVAQGRAEQRGRLAS